MRNEQEPQDILELGVASEATQGADQKGILEASGYLRVMGISDLD